MRCSVTALLLNLAFAIGSASRAGEWNAKGFKTLVTFGDSYTDEGRLGYFINHAGEAPPVGWEQPVGLSTASGGLSWARYASIYSKAKLYNYAVSGAVCSNDVSPRFFSAINASFPSISDYELPAFLADSKFTTPKKTKFFTGTPRDTVYAIWIGTNDLGNDAFLTDSQVPGKTLTDYIDCIYSTIDTLYTKAGGRYFVLMNLAPLNLLPQYSTANGGLPATKFFPEKAGKNITEISYRMLESVATANSVFAYRSPFEAELSGRWDDINIANFDVNALITDIYNNPKSYLNGTAPANVTGYIQVCDVQGNNCSKKESRDSYLWYDELHPSEQASRVVAREFVGVVGGRSRWAKYWG